MPAGPKGPVDDLTREVAALLRARVARMQLTQLEVARRVGLSQSQVSKILRGEGHIDLDQLKAFADALGLDVVAVVTEAEEATARAEAHAEIEAHRSSGQRESEPIKSRRRKAG